ncbi:MAG: hypothetical protein AM1032_000359 [Mycoplasmataceae bacterium]|nr:MAG: hypothetical protein AM1032_000359 [Mycoplasmataceae bacterium]
MNNTQELSGINAQQWLDETYPVEKRNAIVTIGVENKTGKKGLLGILSDSFNSLLYLNIPKNLTGTFTNFQGFINITEINLPSRRIDINSIYNFPISLEKLQLASNDFSESTLEPFSHLINLKYLDIGTMGSKNDDHNQWYGSLEPLKNLTKLNWICLGTTDVDCGLEFLPKHQFINLGFNSDFPGKRCLKIRRILKLINYDLNLFTTSFYNEEYLNSRELLCDFKSITKEINDVSGLASIHYNDISRVLNRAEIEFKREIEIFTDLIFNFERKILEIGKLELDVNNLKSENNFFSDLVIKLENKLNFYIDSQKEAIEKLKITLPLLMNSDVEDSASKIEELQKALIVLGKEVNEKNHELTSTVKENSKFRTEIISNNYLLAFRFIQIKLLNNKLNNSNHNLLIERENSQNLFNLLNFKDSRITELENNLNISNKLLNEINFKYSFEWYMNMGTLFANSPVGKYAIRELNKLPGIQISDQMIENLNLTMFIAKGSGYPKLQYWIIIVFVAFASIAWLFKIIKFSYFKGIDVFNWTRGKKKDLNVLKEAELQAWKNKWNVYKNYSKDDLKKANNYREVFDISNIIN